VAELRFLGTYEGRSKNVGTVRYINLFPDIVGKEIVAIGTPGLALFKNVGPAPIRGLYSFASYLFIVAGNSLYRCVTAGLPVKITDTLSTVVGPVWITDDGNYLVITDGTDGYTYRPSTGVFAKITDVDFPALPGACCFMDGRVLVHHDGTQNFYASDAYNPTSWNALNFGTAQADQDNISTLLSTFSNIFVFGKKNTEIWYNAGTVGFPFAVNPAATFNTGCAAPFSVCRTGDTGNTIIWLARTDQGSGFVVRSEGGSPETISTPEMEYWLSKYSTVNDAEAFAYRIEGHNFYVLTFPTEGKTWAYELAINTWHELSSGVNGGRHRSRCYTYFDGKHIVGDFETGNVYYYDMDNYTDNGENIIRTLIAPTIGDYSGKFRFERFDLLMETGVAGNIGDAGQVMLSMSDDNGHTWGNEHWASIGKQGSFGTRVFWNRLGSAFFKVFKIKISARVKIVLRYAGIRTS